MTTVTFLGAAGTVTGSRHLVTHNGQTILLDCGLFQGKKKWRQRNWQPIGFDVSKLDAIIVSHAHIDHTGYLPRLIKEGFKGKIFSTPATRDLLAIMLPDSGRIQEEDARYANKKKFTKHKPAQPLYTEKDAAKTIPMIQAVPYATDTHIVSGVSLSFSRAGHILGSAAITLDFNNGKRLVFSGDLGRYDTPIVCDPEPLDTTTALIIECTYGDRKHSDADPVADLATEVEKIVKEKGCLIIPAFAIGRTQHILYILRKLQDDGRIPPLPIYVDSPMACNATPLYLMHREEHDDEMANIIVRGEEPIHPKHVSFCRSVAQSRAINDDPGPCIIISASGMATGGRVLHHLKRRLPSKKTTVLFVGYQAYGTRGRRLLEGEKEVKIHGEWIPVNAKIGQVYGFSGHADYEETERWLDSLKKPPENTYCVHGEPSGLEGMAEKLRKRGWNVSVPALGDTVEL